MSEPSADPLPERPPKQRIDEILANRKWAMEHMHMRYETRRDYLQLCAELDHMRVLEQARTNDLEAVARINKVSADPLKEKSRELFEAIQTVCAWEQDYRMRNNLGPKPPDCFIRLAILAAKRSPTFKPACGGSMHEVGEGCADCRDELARLNSRSYAANKRLDELETKVRHK